MASDKFWETKSLAQMTPDEWEALCDGCGLCCLVKIEDEDSGEVFNTSVSCRLLDVATCRCTDYEHRLAKAPMCTRLTLEKLEEMRWLPEWHYLLSGDRNAVHEAGV